jgi:hypothetical protein
MLTLSAAMMMSGCILLAAGGAAGGVIYAKGDLETTLATTPDKVAIATEKAFAQLSITKTWAAASQLEAEIHGLTTTDKKVTIISKSTGEKTCSLSIRVGTFGDKDISQSIFDKIKKNL